MNKTVTYTYPQAIPPTNNTCNSAAVKGSVFPPRSDRSSLRHALGGMLSGVLWVHDGRGITSGWNCDRSILLSVSDISVDNRENPTMVCVVFGQVRQIRFGKGSLSS
jgi:hypothetical protein